MARKRHTGEEIVTKLRQVDVLTASTRPRHCGAQIGRHVRDHAREDCRFRPVQITVAVGHARRKA